MRRRPLRLTVMAIGYPLLLILVYLWGPQQLSSLLRPPHFRQIGYSAVRESVTRYLAEREGSYAVYFQDLTSGVTWGIGEDRPLPPASLIKVPVVLYLYQQVAAGKLRWEDRIPYTKADFQKGDGALQYTVREGESYSLRTLATASITISDNIAHNMLVRFLGKEKLLGFMKGYGVAIDRPYGGAPTAARGLGEVLAGVVEFNRRHPALGGRLIDDLSHTIFHVGLPGLLPPSLQVAHKEGSIDGVAADMGIVCSRRPYTLVVLAEGIPSEDYGFDSIQRISKLIYDFQQQLPPARVKGLPAAR